MATKEGRGIKRLLLPLIVLLAMLLSLRAEAASNGLHFRVFANTGLRLTDIVWTGGQFLYIENTTNRVFAAGPAGMPLQPFAAMPRRVEETRCVISPGSHGFPARAIYCHAPDNKIYRLSPGGTHVSLFAVLPHAPRSDGALTFDSEGRFGYTLLAATGRSGGPRPRGGAVFAIDHAGRVRRIGKYSNPGGADEIAVAPASFGAASGQVLLPVDAGRRGSLVAMDASGRTRTLVHLPDGPNPIAVLVPGRTPPAGVARPGLYVTDTTSHRIFFAPAAALRRFRGDVLIGSELRGLFWVVRPRGRGFAVQRIAPGLPPKSYNLEAAVYVSP